MELRLIFSIITIFTSGLHNFSIKVAAEKNYNVSIINLYSYILSTIIVGFVIIFKGVQFELLNFKLLLFFAFGNGLFFFLSMFSRVKSMQNIDAVIFFPLYKTIGPIIITFVSLFFFKEVLTLKEIIGIIIGICVPLLLITHSEKKRQKNLFLGIGLLLVTAVLTAISSAMLKEVMIRELSVLGTILISSIFGIVFSLISMKLTKKNKKKFNHKGIAKFSLISGLLHLSSFTSFILALKGNLAVVFTISSFGILIPIILSIIFYKDHFNFKKGVIILLSIISVILFI